MAEIPANSRPAPRRTTRGWRRVPRREIDAGRVRNDGLSIYYEATGDPDAEPVVFLEGWGVGRWMWRWQRPALADRFRVVVPDNRGTGRSDTPSGPASPAELLLERATGWWADWLTLCSPPAVTPWMQWPTATERPFTISDMAADVEAVLSELSVREAHVVGASMGGMIALQYALEYDRAKSLTLLGATPGRADGVLPPTRVQTTAVASAGRRLDRAELRRRTRLALSDEFVAAHPDIVERILDWRRETDATPQGRFLQAVAATGFDVSDSYHRIRVPVHVLHGTADTIVPVENGRRLADRLPNATYTPIPGGSHFFFVEQARRVNEHLMEFLY